MGIAGTHCFDAAVDSEHGVDGRAHVVLEAREVQQIALGIESDAQGLTVECHGGATHRDRPGDATDLCQRGHDFRPGCAQQLDFPTLVRGGMSLRALSWGSAVLSSASSAGRPRWGGTTALAGFLRIRACRRGVSVFRSVIDRTVVVGGIWFAWAGPAVCRRRVATGLTFALWNRLCGCGV